MFNKGTKHTEETKAKLAGPSLNKTYAAYVRKLDISVGKYLRTHMTDLYNKIIDKLGL